MGMRDCFRAIRTQPATSASIVTVLALCLGANSALFTVVNALLLRPLPFPGSEQLVEVSLLDGEPVSPQAVAEAGSVRLAGSFLSTSLAVAGPDGVRNVFGFRVTGGLTPLLGFRPALGRALTGADYGRKVVMIGYEYWQELGAPPDIEGQALTIDGEVYFIAGVLPAGFFLSVRDAKLIVPDLASGGRTLARLHPGVTAAAARAGIESVLKGKRVRVTPLAQAFQPSDSRPVLLLLATAALVLLITCANLANLQLVRGLARRREFAVRTAMGASHGKLVAQLACESGLLGAAGAALGLLLTRVLHDAILGLLPANVARRMAGADPLAADVRVILFSLAAALLTVIIFGVLPGLSSLRFDITAALRDAGRTTHGARRKSGSLLVAVEIMLAVMLLAGAALSFKSLARLESRYLGFRGGGVLRVMTGFLVSRYPNAAHQVAVYREVERRIGAIAGAAEVGIVAPQVFPFGGPGVRGAPFEIFGRPGLEARAEVYAANPAYPRAIRLPLLRGRWFTDADTAAAQPVAVLSESVAARYWPREDCVGGRVRFSGGAPPHEWVTIVGVVGDVRNPMGAHWQPTAYRPFAQTPHTGATLMIRSGRGAPQALAGAVRREMRAIDPSAPAIRLVDPLDAAVRDYSAAQRFTTRMLGVFAAIGLALAAAGVYGVMRYWVASRTGEIGVRVALGAQRSEVLRLVLGRALAAAAVGSAAGLLGALALRKVIASMLVDVSATDPVILAAVAGAVITVALISAWPPARRATRIDPATALRAE